MITNRTPHESRRTREQEAIRRREEMADFADRRQNPVTRANRDELEHDGDFVANFTKGLPHNDLGIAAGDAYQRFVTGINSSDPNDMNAVPIGPNVSDPNAVLRTIAGGAQTLDDNAVVNFRPSGTSYPTATNDFATKLNGAPVSYRNWESPRSGHTYVTQGPDPDFLEMPAAPALGSAELALEMAEVYAMSILRDSTLEEVNDPAHQVSVRGSRSISIQAIVDELDQLLTVALHGTSEPRARARLTGRLLNGAARLQTEHLFRGSSPDVEVGHHLSQFMLVGNDRPANGGAGGTPTCSSDGEIAFGRQAVQQRLITHKVGLDHMRTWQGWLDVQNGADVRGADEDEPDERFITTLRDLASYVHFDALYQAYLNAALILNGRGHPADLGFPSGDITVHATRGSFVTFGDPHILSLVTEVATRALRTVRRQKFNYHRRARPEAIAGYLTLFASNMGGNLGSATQSGLSTLQGHLDQSASSILEAVENLQTGSSQRLTINKPDPTWFVNGRNLLLPMAFPEGSPMHPAYGAGHATVAGACVTILKAFFETFDLSGLSLSTRATLHQLNAADIVQADAFWAKRLSYGSLPERNGDVGTGTLGVYKPDGMGVQLIPNGSSNETLIGELNKLAANVSIGRNIAGVHYYSDYYESVRAGERIAIGMLQDQMLTYPEPVSMRIESFDGERLSLSTNGRSDDDGVAFAAADKFGNLRDQDSTRAWWTANPRRTT